MASDDEADDGLAPVHTMDLIIKNPDGPDATFPGVDACAKIRDIKEMLFETYPGRPVVTGQKLIFAGRLLKDSDVLGNVANSHSVSIPVVFHLLVKSGANSEPSSPALPSPGSPERAVAAQPLPLPASADPPAAPLASPARQDPAVAPASEPARTPAPAAAVAPASPAQPSVPTPAAAPATPVAAVAQPSPAPAPTLQSAFPYPASPGAFPAAHTPSAALSFSPAMPAFPAPIVSPLASPPSPYALGACGAAALLAASPEQQAALAAQVRQVYYDAYYKTYLAHFAAAEATAAAAAEATADSPPGAAADAQGENVEAEEGAGEAAPPPGERPVELHAGVRAQLGGGAGGRAEAGVGDGDGAKALKLAAKLAFVVAVLGQDASHERLCALCATALAILLHQTGYLPLLPWLQRQAVAPRGAARERFGDGAVFEHGDADAGADGADGAVRGAGEDGAGPLERGGEGLSGLLVDLLALFVGFFTSLVPQPVAPHQHAF